MSKIFSKTDKVETTIKGVTTFNEIPLETNLLSEKELIDYSKQNEPKPIKSKFKLITVRVLTDKTIEELQYELDKQYQKLNQIAVANNQPVLYPNPPISNTNLKQIYAVYIDEDLYGFKSIYTFYSPSKNIRAYITATGPNKNDYLATILHPTELIKNPNGTYRQKWRIYTVEYIEQVKKEYVFDSSSLPEYYEYNYDLNSIDYLGGGSWFGFGLDPNDRRPLVANAPVNDQYIPTGPIIKQSGKKRQKSIVNYSWCPTSSFTYNRDKFIINYTEKNFKAKFDLPTYLDNGYYKHTRSSNYKLGTTYRVEKNYTQDEICNSTAVYIANNNGYIASTYKGPDYGTDYLRFSLESYTQETNILRKPLSSNKSNLSILKLSSVEIPTLPVISCSTDARYFIKLKDNLAKGDIKHHPYLVRTRGSRGISYFDSYKYWWTYGKIINFEIIENTWYLGYSIAGVEQTALLVPDKGELIQIKPNVLMTTWDAPPNPPTGLFFVATGTLIFDIDYICPPFFGHEGPYYYEINPPRFGDYFGGQGDRIVDPGSTGNISYTFQGLGTQSGSPGDQAIAQQNSLQFQYSQILGAMRGVTSGVGEQFEGHRDPAPGSGETLVVRNPNEETKAILQANPEIFPVNFIESDAFNESWNEAGYNIDHITLD